MKRFLAGITFAAVSMGAQAATILDEAAGLPQSEFRLLSEDLGAAFSYKALTPAEPLGVTGFDISIERTATRLQHPALFDKAGSGPGVDTLQISKLHLHKGLPSNVDVGFFISQILDSDMDLKGAELSYALLDGGVTMPALALRGSYTQFSSDQLDLNTRGLELAISKGLAMVTPYAGVGRVWTTSTEALRGLNYTGWGSAPDPLKEKFAQNKMLVGANLNFGLMNLAVEGDKTGEATTYGLKLGLRW